MPETTKTCGVCGATCLVGAEQCYKCHTRFTCLTTEGSPRPGARASRRQAFARSSSNRLPFDARTIRTRAEDDVPLEPVEQTNIKQQIANQISDLKSKDSSWPDAIALGEISPATAIPALIEAMKDDDPFVRHCAALSLGEIGSAAVPALIEALSTAFTDVRQSAAYALGKLPNHTPRNARSAAAYALGRIRDTSAIPALIEALKDDDGEGIFTVGAAAASSLGDIGDTSSVPALIEALTYVDLDVRSRAAYELGKIGDTSAIPALVEALNDNDDDYRQVRRNAAWALGNMGAPGILALITALKNKNGETRSCSAFALQHIGDADTLPRKILANTQFSPHERINVLERLRNARYSDQYITLRYKFPDTIALCQTILNEADTEAHEGAQSVLDWINEGSKLLRGSQADTTTQSQDLVRPASGGDPVTKPETLLRASDGRGEDVDLPRKKPTIWQRLFGK